MPDAIATATFRLFNEGGAYRIPTDSGLGGLYRPHASGQRDGRTATLETYYDFFINNVPDPDEAVRLDPRIPDKIRMHPDVQAAFRKRQLTVASYPDRIDPNPLAPDQGLARDIARWVELVWRQIPNTQKLYSLMQTAVIDGGIGIEWVWHREAAGFERPVNWYPVHKSRFVKDRLGNMALRTRYDPVWGAYVSPDPNQRLNQLIDDRGLLPSIEQIPGKFTYHTHLQLTGTWDRPDLEGYFYFGLGEDVVLYYPVIFDIFVVRARMKWLEKYGDPPTDIYYPETMAGIEPVLKRIADSVRGESITTIPKTPGLPIDQGSYVVHQRDVPSMSYDAFERFSDGWTEKRVNKILLGAADEGQKGEHGGYSDHMSRKESGPQVFFGYDARNISATLTNQLLPAICLARWPNLPAAYWPVLLLEPKEERDRQQEAEIIKTASALIPILKDEAYEKLGFRKPNEGDDTIEASPEQGMPPGMGGQQGVPGQKQLPPGGKPPPPADAPAHTGKPRAPIGQGPGNGAVANKPPKPPAMPLQRTMPRAGMK